MRRSFSTTTALLTSLALAVPATFPAIAQERGSDNEPAVLCSEDMSAEDCQALRDDPATGEEAVEAPPPEAEPEAEAAPETLLAPETDEAPAEDAPVDEAPAEAPADEAPAEAAPSDAAPADETPVEEAPTDAAPADEAPAVEAPADEAPAQEPPADVESLQEALGAETEAGREPAVETEAETEADAGPQVEAEGEAEVQAEAPANPRRRPEASAEAPADEASGEVADGTPDGPSQAAQEAATGEAEASMAASGDDETVSEVSETVTEDSVRRSDEDFAESVPPAGTLLERRDDEPTFLQGALLGAAGALVVGALLNGNREVVSSTPDRVVVRDPNGDLQVLRDDDAILRQPGAEMTTRTYSDGSTQTVMVQPDGSQIITIRNAEARVVKRVVIAANGTETVLFDDTLRVEPVDVATLPMPERSRAPRVDPDDEAALRRALMAESGVSRRFSLNQIRQIDRVRYLAPSAQVDSITFETGSAAVSPTEAQELIALGQLMTSLIADNPNEVFLIEGHTDAVGSAVSNLSLSDRRAESVARALTEYFGVAPANMVLQGYGESDLRVPTEAPERENRRVVVRRITPLLQVAQAN